MIAYTRRAPGKVLIGLLGFHFVAWTALPLLLCPNLQHDLVEGLALGREWQLGYWKHPPLPWWIDDAIYRLTGTIDAVYVLGPLAGVTCLYAVWLLAREMAGPMRALTAVFALEGIHFYNFSAVKFSQDPLQLPVWAFTALFFYRALTRERAFDWLLAGTLLALALWTKYSVFVLAAALGLFLLFDRDARRVWRTPGPYLMALAFIVVVAPNIWWLTEHNFQPVHYADVRSRVAETWLQYAGFPLRWIASQVLFLAPAIVLVALLYRRRSALPRPSGDRAAFDRRYVAMLALGPFAVVTLLFGALGRLPVAMWGFPFWSFAPLAVLMWWPPAEDMQRLKRFALGAVAVTVAFPLVYAAIEIGEPFLRDRPKATEFPGRAMATMITKTWHERFGTPLTYVGGTEFVTNTVAVYSPDRPHIIPHGEIAFAPWVDRAELVRRGGVLVWEGEPNQAQLASWRATFGAFTAEPPLILPRQTWAKVMPSRLNYAFIAPKP